MVSFQPPQFQQTLNKQGTTYSNNFSNNLANHKLEQQLSCHPLVKHFNSQSSIKLQSRPLGNHYSQSSHNLRIMFSSLWLLSNNNNNHKQRKDCLLQYVCFKSQMQFLVCLKHFWTFYGAGDLPLSVCLRILFIT